MLSRQGQIGKFLRKPLAKGNLTGNGVVAPARGRECQHGHLEWIPGRRIFSYGHSVSKGVMKNGIKQVNGERSFSREVGGGEIFSKAGNQGVTHGNGECWSVGTSRKRARIAGLSEVGFMEKMEAAFRGISRPRLE